jgi:hypothetical protein
MGSDVWERGMRIVVDRALVRLGKVKLTMPPGRIRSWSGIHLTYIGRLSSLFGLNIPVLDDLSPER